MQPILPEEERSKLQQRVTLGNHLGNLRRFALMTRIRNIKFTRIILPHSTIDCGFHAINRDEFDFLCCFEIVKICADILQSLSKIFHGIFVNHRRHTLLCHCVSSWSNLQRFCNFINTRVYGMVSCSVLFCSIAVSIFYQLGPINQVTIIENPSIFRCITIVQIICFGNCVSCSTLLPHPSITLCLSVSPFPMLLIHLHPLGGITFIYLTLGMVLYSGQILKYIEQDMFLIICRTR